MGKSDSNAGLPVLLAIPGSPAHKFGVRSGDVIVAVNGQRVITAADYFRAKSLDRMSSRISIIRDGILFIEIDVPRGQS